MSATKKTLPSPNETYKLAAAARRARLATVEAPIPGEIKPLRGRIRVTLNGTLDHPDSVLGDSGPRLIDIPEFAAARKLKAV